MVNRKLVWAVCGAAVFALMVTSSAPRVGATAAAKTTYLTFSKPVALPGVALRAGTYIFEIANPDTSADVVRVMSRDRSISYFMGFTHAVARPNKLNRDQNVSLVIISAPEHVRAVRQRLEDPAIAVFADTDSLRALEAIRSKPPRIVVLNSLFAETARGAALVAQLKGDSRLSGIDLRVLIEDEDKVPLLLAEQTASPENALLETSRPLGRAGTRAALRYVMDRRSILVNGDRGQLIDLSVTGAQIVVPARVRPNEPVRLVLSDDAGELASIISA